MRVRRGALVTGVFGLVLAGALLGPGVASLAQEATQDSIPIRLRVGSYDPGKGQHLDLPAAERTGGGGQATYLVQFSGPIREGWRAEIEKRGARILDYVPDFAYRARLSADQATALRGLSIVRAVELFQPGMKLDPALKR